jgi:hypothetical protein
MFPGQKRDQEGMVPGGHYPISSCTWSQPTSNMKLPARAKLKARCRTCVFATADQLFCALKELVTAPREEALQGMRPSAKEWLPKRTGSFQEVSWVRRHYGWHHKTPYSALPGAFVGPIPGVCLAGLLAALLSVVNYPTEAALGPAGAAGGTTKPTIDSI